MKRWLSLGIVVAILVAALVMSQRRKPQADVGPDAVLHFIGDTERELSRIPLSATRISDADEIRIGDELAERYKSMESLDDKSTDDKPDASKDENAAFRRYVTQVGNTVAAHATRKLPYKFHYIPENYMMNAFAIPGGHVYIGKGLLDLMDSEDELASVLGHEIEHIDRRHAVERLQTEARLRHLGVLRLLVELPLDIFQAGYSREQELEADREGTRLAVASGYSPTGAIRIFEAFDRRFREAKEAEAKSPQEEAARVVLDTMGGYFRSHPASQERITQIRNLIAQENWPAHQEKPFELAFLLWTDRAQSALRQHRYKEAAGLAARALENKSDHEPAVHIECDAEFYQAKFSRAAEIEGLLFKAHPAQPGYAQYLAHLMFFSDRQHALMNFSQKVGANLNSSFAITDALAGLQLAAGKPQAAERLYLDLKNDPADERAPERLNWLAWWHYLAGDSQAAFAMLDSASQQRPDDNIIVVNFAWSAIEQRRYDQALKTLHDANTIASGYPRQVRSGAADPIVAEISMATAVAHWLAKQPDEALGNYVTALDREPAWKNAAWYAPQYSPLVSRAIAEMKSELERRKKAAEANRTSH